MNLDLWTRMEGEKSESQAHSFVIKIWLEETAQPSGQVIWRGRVTHVPSGEQWYFTDLERIRTIIAPYLQAMGASPPQPRWYRRWWRG